MSIQYNALTNIYDFQWNEELPGIVVTLPVLLYEEIHEFNDRSEGSWFVCIGYALSFLATNKEQSLVFMNGMVFTKKIEPYKALLRSCTYVGH